MFGLKRKVTGFEITFNIKPVTFNPERERETGFEPADISLEG